jgi:hypothetical protein
MISISFTGVKQCLLIQELMTSSMLILYLASMTAGKELFSEIFLRPFLF